MSVPILKPLSLLSENAADVAAILVDESICIEYRYVLTPILSATFSAPLSTYPVISYILLPLACTVVSCIPYNSISEAVNVLSDFKVIVHLPAPLTIGNVNNVPAFV